VRDDHACGALASHGILVNSSNIGAVKVGSLLARNDWASYLDVYGLRRSLSLPMPNERQGHVASKGWLPGIKEPAFKKWTGSSYSIGYEHQVNAMQMARAYLTMLSGSRRELRLVRSVTVDGNRIEQPIVRGQREFSADTVELVRAALSEVISDDEGATGRHMVAAFRKEGTELVGLLAGKTGTAKSRTVIKGKGTVEVRNASFVGFMPAAAPRYLAVCVLQRDDSARFYGGSYAAPPAARLLLEAMRLEERRRLGQGPQVSATPGSSGRGLLAAETGQAGR
jgi:cell division protein FtsI (penicillin-binding protein 3)